MFGKKKKEAPQGLEGIVGITRQIAPKSTMSEDLLRVMGRIGQGDRRDYTSLGTLGGHAKTFTGSFFSFLGSRFSTSNYDDAKAVLEPLTHEFETVPGGAAEPTFRNVIATVLTHSMDFDRYLRSGDYEHAKEEAGAILQLLRARFQNNGKLISAAAELSVRSLLVHGWSQAAYDVISPVPATDPVHKAILDNNPDLALMRADIAYSFLGEYREAEADLYSVYRRDPNRVGGINPSHVSQKLAQVYTSLADITPRLTDATAGIDAAVLNSWAEVRKHLSSGAANELAAKANEVITGIGDPAADPNKTALLSKAYHALAMSERRGMSYGSATEHLRMSVGLTPTPQGYTLTPSPEAYINLAEIHSRLGAPRMLPGRR